MVSIVMDSIPMRVTAPIFPIIVTQAKYTGKWPVDPKYLFEHYYDDNTADVMWSYADNYGNNNAERSQPDPSDESGGELKLH